MKLRLKEQLPGTPSLIVCQCYHDDMMAIEQRWLQYQMNNNYCYTDKVFNAYKAAKLWCWNRAWTLLDASKSVFY